MQPTSGTGTVALHSTDCIHFLIICCISLTDGILKRSLSIVLKRFIQLVQSITLSQLFKSTASKHQQDPRHITRDPRPRPSFEAEAVKIAPRGTTSLRKCE